MSDLHTVDLVLSHFPNVTARTINPLGGAGGFSGARFWKIQSEDEQLCLRRWPQEHPSRTQLQAIHDVLLRAVEQGFLQLPLPVRSRDGSTIVYLAGHFWELARWLPGVADFHANPTSERLDAAMQTLARFHLSTRPANSPPSPAPGILSRGDHLRRLLALDASDWSRDLTALNWPEFQQRATSILHFFDKHAQGIQMLLSTASKLRVRLQPCIRDIWHDHVLFEANQVSGFVDFGAMRVDHVGCDIARLLGSLIGDTRDRWKRGLEAYQSVLPLSPDEMTLVDAFDRSTVLLSGMNWLHWVAVECRQFEDGQRVLNRLDEILLRLRHL
ncbi:MAG: phosphotransferase [Planctomycetaceae bacterium]|nr:phosphotransferase [Planctomycetales bacterium]MCB9927521.1 phosphotransferase [Planctomycetaceae bacterium]